MEEIRTWAEKHIEAEEDLNDQLEAECQPLAPQAKLGSPTEANQEGRYKTQARSNDEQAYFTPLKAKRAQILREVYHTQLLDFPPTTSWQLGPSREEWCKEVDKEKLRERSRSRQCPNTSYHGTIATISRGGIMGGKIVSTKKRHVWAILFIKDDPLRARDLVICFSDEDYRGISPQQDDPMGSGRPREFFQCSLLVDVSKAGTSYVQFGGVLRNLIRVGPRPFDGKKAFVNFLDLDPCQQLEDMRTRLVEELKEVQIGPSRLHRTKVNRTLDKESKDHLVRFLTKNQDVFTWSSTDMLGIDPDFLCHHLSITLGT
ncbi:hypothetical protein CR513_56144, partial [Mucuna pruriens]